ncbi:hypothetical protein VTL71DRAFT_9499 [Oculimacula yallundae]|uniref:Uncharacterized protein n=1 Tax=Oculimacula yallundae TaxID=86028 RepID=A0ABR4BS63_9HELO
MTWVVNPQTRNGGLSPERSETIIRKYSEELIADGYVVDQSANNSQEWSQSWVHECLAEELVANGILQALWEQSNEIKWNKSKENERDYVLEAFQDIANTSPTGSIRSYHGYAKGEYEKVG